MANRRCWRAAGQRPELSPLALAKPRCRHVRTQPARAQQRQCAWTPTTRGEPHRPEPAPGFDDGRKGEAILTSGRAKLATGNGEFKTATSASWRVDNDIFVMWK